MLVKFKALPNNECCIMNNGSVYVFDFKGDCILTDAGLLPKYTSNMIDVVVCSFITLNGVTEVLVTKGDKATSYTITKPISDVIVTTMSMGKYIRALKQKTIIDDISVTNYLFVYTMQTDLSDILLTKLGATLKKVYEG